MTTEPETSSSLGVLAQEFADTLTDRVHKILITDVHFTAWARVAGMIGVGYIVDNEYQTFPLYVDGQHRLDLLVKLHCRWDSPKSFLAVQESWFHVFAAGKDRTPLFRYEYVRTPTRDVPCAHLQVHAHRDEVTYLLVNADKRRPGDRLRRGKVPRFAEFHFPLGGARFRPCLEDLLHALIVEFGVDCQREWRRAVEEGREEWRRRQLRAAVRDAPREALRALEEAGCLPRQAVPSPALSADRTRGLRSF